MRLFALAASVVAALTLAGAAAADQTYTDSTGEVAGAIDVSTVAVSNDPLAGTITFAVTTNYFGPIDGNVNFTIALDTDKNRNTGLQGFDYLVGLNNQGSRAVSMLNLTWHEEPRSSFASGVWTITLPVADIGSPKSFDFRIYTDLGPSPPREDVAPDTGLWSYELTTPPPPPAPVTVSRTTVSRFGVPTHGKVFRVTGLAVGLSDGTATTAIDARCRATLGRAHLTGTGPGGCTLRLPVTSKGKKLTVKVSGRYGSTPVAGRLSLRVR